VTYLIVTSKRWYLVSNHEDNLTPFIRYSVISREERLSDFDFLIIFSFESPGGDSDGC
jgi:hypothetical protein